MPPLTHKDLSLLHSNYKDYPIFIETGTFRGWTCFPMEEYFDAIHTIELNQDYYWGEDGYFRLHRKELTSYMIKYQKSDKTIKIYCIKTPEGYYIGATKTNLPVRLKEHIKDYKDYTKGCKKKLPLLYDSLDKYPFEESYNMIKNAYVLKEVQGTHKEKFQLETEYIHQFIMEGKKLLNKLKANLEISK